MRQPSTVSETRTLVKHYKSETENVDKTVAQSVTKNSMGRHNDGNVIQDSVPDVLLGPQFDFIQASDDPGPHTRDTR